MQDNQHSACSSLAGSTDFLLRIIPNHNGEWRGRIEHIQSGQAWIFNSYVEMVLLIEVKLAELGVPPTVEPFRSWKDKIIPFPVKER